MKDLSALPPSRVPALRRTGRNDAPPRPDGDHVLYWMIASRRPGWSFALDRAIELARAWNRPLIVFEALRCDYPWASDRHHAFVIDGMKANAAAFSDSPVAYLPYVEPQAGAGKGLLAALAARACAVVTDEWPAFFLPRMVDAAAAALDVHLEAVDGCGLLPLRASDKAWKRAVDFRRHLQKTGAPHLSTFPTAEPLAGLELPRASLPDLDRWAPTDLAALDLSALPIDHSVGVVEDTGGHVAAGERWSAWLSEQLQPYGEGRNHPDEDTATGLSPWLHYGQLSPHQMWADIAGQEGWAPDDLAEKSRGQREGWWGLSTGAEAFLDELVTWRELGLNGAFHMAGFTDFVLPDWAHQTLDHHRGDPREYLYDLATLEAAETHDEIWNAAQRQLRAEGRIHNYLRMLWGKKVLQWSETPQRAWEVLVHLNNRWATDGRDPNSYSGIGWVFGRYDRAWGPERPIFGKVRYMTSESTKRKLRMTQYLERWGD